VEQSNHIPAGPEDLTPERLTEMLRVSDRLRTSKVTGVETEILGEGEGFLGTIVRHKLSYDHEEATAPASLIAKFPISLDLNRGLAESVGVYEREIRFYRDLAAKTKVRKPELYYSAMDSNPMLEKTDQIERLLNPIPAWLIKLVLPLLTKFNSRSKRRYVLLMEDLSPAMPGNQVKGCGFDVAKVIVRELAIMHSGWWQSPELDEIKWLTRINYLAPFMHKIIKGETDSFIAALSAEMPVAAELIPSISDHIIELVDRLSEPPITLLHGDYRLDNMCLSGNGSDVKMTLFDWQTMILGRGPFDLAYFITGNLPTEEALKVESQLVRVYHSTLLENGVKGYDYDTCMTDYELSKLGFLYRMMAINIDLIDLGDGRGADLIEVWMSRLLALIPQDWERLLDEFCMPPLTDKLSN